LAPHKKHTPNSTVSHPCPLSFLRLFYLCAWDFWEISRWLYRKGFRIATSPCPNIHQATRSDKLLPPPPLQQSGVYCIPIILADGTTSSYIGSTIRCLDLRLREHLKACREWNVYSVLAQTTMSGGQPIWKDATIVGTARNTSLLRWKEALFIHSHHTVNQPSVQLNSTLIQATGIKYSTTSTTQNCPHHHTPSLSFHCPGWLTRLVTHIPLTLTMLSLNLKSELYLWTLTTIPELVYIETSEFYNFVLVFIPFLWTIYMMINKYMEYNIKIFLIQNVFNVYLTF